MECSRIISNTVCCLLLTVICVNTQNPCYDPNAPDRICFVEDLSIQPQWDIQQPLTNQQLLPNQWQIDNQPALAIQQQAARQQALANQQPLVNQWQAASQQPLANQWRTPSQQSLGIPQQKASPQPLGIRQQTGSQQPLGNPQPLDTRRQTVNQHPLTPNNLNVVQDKDQFRNVTAMRENKIVRLDETSTALTNFSLNLMKYVSLQSAGNTVVSPHSIATLLALLQQGAAGGTLDELSMALHMDQLLSAATFKTYSDDVQKRRSRNILKTANNIFIADGFSLNRNFRAIALRDFRSDVTPTNFALAVETAREINNWVAARTDNKIQNLISPDVLGTNTQMVLVNAIYFKGLWEIPFRREATNPGDFLLSSGSVIKAQFMQSRRYYRTGTDSDTGAKVIVLPFERNEYSLLVILPHKLSSIADTLSLLSPSRLENYLNFPHLEARLELPRFSIKGDTDLSIVLKNMGIEKLFGISELPNIGTYQDNKSPQVSTAVHSAALTIDEEGGSAAASTAFAVVALSNDEPSVVFKANRPFLAVLWDLRSNLPLFTAKIENPTL